MKTEKKSSNGKILYFSRLRAIACFAVVILHTFYACVRPGLDNADMSVLLSVRNLMMWAVPVFVMVTGALLLNKGRKLTYEKLFKRYILRMVLALLIFTLLFSLYDAISKGTFGFLTFTGAAENILYGTGWSHMWYLYLMIAIYLLLPFYRMIAAMMKKADSFYMLVVFGAFLLFIPMLETLTEKKTAFYICIYTVYPFYLFLGYILSKKMFRPGPVGSIVVIIASSSAIAILTVYSVYHGSSKLSGLLGNYSFPLIACQAYGVFSLAAGAEGGKIKVLDTILAEIDRCSFGIYLIHMLYLKLVVVTIGFNPLEHGGIVTIAVLTVVVFIVSYATVFLLKFIPYVKKLL